MLYYFIQSAPRWPRNGETSMICNRAILVTFLDTFKALGCTVNREWYKLSIHITVAWFRMLLHKYAAAMYDRSDNEGKMCTQDWSPTTAACHACSMTKKFVPHSRTFTGHRKVSQVPVRVEQLLAKRTAPMQSLGTLARN